MKNIVDASKTNDEVDALRFAVTMAADDVEAQQRKYAMALLRLEAMRVKLTKELERLANRAG